MSEYGGWKVNGLTIGVTHLPNRKNPVLYTQRDGIMYACASFKHEELAKHFYAEFTEMIRMLGGEEHE